MKEKRKYLLVSVIILFLVGTCAYFYIQNKGLITLLQHKNLFIAKQTAVIDSIKRSGLDTLMSNMLDKIDDELNQNPKRVLSDERIASLAALCYLLKPYASLEGDSVSLKKLSPERGQMLLMLCKMKMDSTSFQKIKTQASFAGADLKDADLRGVDLSKAELTGANFKNANLEDADFREANMNFVNLWGADLKRAKLSLSQLKRADLSWANLNESDLRGANLHEADLISTQLRNANLHSAILQWTDFSGAFLTESDLSNTDMFRATLKRSQLSKANMSGANLTYAIVSEANLTEANLTEANLTNLIIADPRWLELLNDWKVYGAKEIQSQYKIVEGFSYEHSKYQLNKI